MLTWAAQKIMGAKCAGAVVIGGKTRDSIHAIDAGGGFLQRAGIDVGRIDQGFG